jgi:EmrB/QacA subfamily drug resistance transporter
VRTRQVSDTVAAVQGGTSLPLLTTFGLLAGPLVSMLDSSIVNVAVPVLARDLHAGLGMVQWAVSAYLLALGAALSASAYLAKRLGTKTAYIASLAAFTAASVLCALAPSIDVLIAARVLQGAVGAALLPVSMSMLMGGQSEQTRGQIPPLVGVMLLAAPALGPTVGGALIGAFGWPSIFMVNVPFGVLGILGVMRLSPAIASPADRKARFDPLGVLMLGGGLGLGLYGLASAQEDGWVASGAWPFWAAGLALLAAYVVWASRVEHPAVDLGLVRGLQSTIGLSVIVLGVVVLGAVLFMVPVYVQAIQGFSAFHAGLVLLPQDVVMAGGLVLGDRLSKRGLARASAIGGAGLLIATTAILLTLSVTTPSWMVATMLAGRGLALALIIQPILDALMRGIPMAKLADANTLFNVIQRVAGSFAIALLATLLEQRERFHLSQALHGVTLPAFDSASGTGPSLAGLPEGLQHTVQAALMAGWLDLVVVLVVVSAATFVTALLFQPQRAIAREFSVGPADLVDEASTGLVA